MFAEHTGRNRRLHLVKRRKTKGEIFPMFPSKPSETKSALNEAKPALPNTPDFDVQELGENADRKLKAYTMKVKGAASYRDIGRTFGVSTATAFRDVKDVLELHNRTCLNAIDEARQMELERLDVALFAIMPQVKKGNLLAIDRMLAISKRRSELLGLDAAKRLEMTGKDGGAIQTETTDIRERWTPQEAASKARELLRRMEVAQREMNRVQAVKARPQDGDERN